MGVMHEPTAGEYAASSVHDAQRSLRALEQRVAATEKVVNLLIEAVSSLVDKQKDAEARADLAALRETA